MILLKKLSLINFQIMRKFPPFCLCMRLVYLIDRLKGKDKKIQIKNPINLPQ